MPNAKPSRRKPTAVSPWCGPDVDTETLNPNERLAHEIVVQRRDLTPSVTRIMDAPLTEEARASALGAFGASLTTPGDPNRDPSVAIANAMAAS
jgi:hypothetical protein